MEVKLGEEKFLEELIRFCYSKQITFTEGEPLALFSAGSVYAIHPDLYANDAEKSVLRLMQMADRLLMSECGMSVQHP